jgi:hypothetical protein
MIPAEKWWRIVEAYLARIWPAQIIFYVVAMLLTGWLLLKPGRVQSRLTKLYLSIAFAWNGVMFFIVLAPGITGDSYGNYLFGTLFTVVALLFAVDLFRQRMEFLPPTHGWRAYATWTMIGLVLCYPLIGLALGHELTSLIVPGTMPCPTTAFALILLTTALPRVDRVAYVLLLLWAIPLPPFIQIPKYGVYEDAVMFASGVYSLILLLLSWRTEGLSG